MQPLSVTADLDELDTISDYVKAAAQAAQLDGKTAYKLRLAVDEIVTNIISHGYEEAGLQGNLEMQAQVDEQQLIISIEDTARPYDPRQALPPDLEADLEARPIGGLGVYLALKSVDHFHYERIGNRNRNIFVVKKPTTSVEE